MSGVLPGDELERRLAGSGAAVVMKLGRNLAKVREAVDRAGLLDRAHLRRAGRRWTPSGSCRSRGRPGGGALLLDGRDPERTTPDPMTGSQGGSAHGGRARTGRRRDLTPDALDGLTDATDLVGYATYLDMVPADVAGRRHPSDNREEAARAARRARPGRRWSTGRRSSSSGDPGVFAMATAVLEQLDDRGTPHRWAASRSTCCPGVTAAQAAAARIGAPLGPRLLPSSPCRDNLKPWAVVEQRVAAAAGADFVLALYNPLSRPRPYQYGRALSSSSASTVTRHARGRGPRRRPARRDRSRGRAGRRGRRRGQHADGRDRRVIDDPTVRPPPPAPVVYTPRRYPARLSVEPRRATSTPRLDERTVGRRSAGGRPSPPAGPAAGGDQLGDGRVAAASSW